MKLKYHLIIIWMVLSFQSCSSLKRSDITILYTTSVEGEYEPCGCPTNPLGGISKRAKYVEELKEREKNVLIIDSGDLFFKSASVPLASKEQWRMKAELLARAYRIMGVEATGTGEVDLAMGVDFLKEVSTANGIKLIASNIIQPVDVFLPYIIIKKNLRRIGIISAVESALIKTEGVKLQDVRESLNEILKKLSPEVDIVILLSHLAPEDEKNLLISRNDINIIISSHAGYSSQKPLQVGNGLIVSAGNRGKYIGILRLTFYGEGPFKLVEEGKKNGNVIYSGEWIPVEQELKNHEEIDKLIAEYNKRVAEINARPSVIENITYVSEEVCKNCHRAQYNFWKRTKHAHAFKTLEKVNKSFDPECIGCHTTGFKKPGGFTVPANVGSMKNVQCEACHIDATEHAKNRFKARPEKIVPETICGECHTPERSPDFNYVKRLPLISCPGGT